MNDQDTQNTTTMLMKIFGIEPFEAEVLAKLYVISKHYNVNLSLLLPVIEGLINLEQFDDNGKVILNTGKKPNQPRYYSVEVRRTIFAHQPPLDDKV